VSNVSAAAEPTSTGSPDGPSSDPGPFALDPDDGGVPRHDVPRGGRSGFTVVRDRQVHYLEWGRIDAPTVFCLHGGGQTAYMFEEIGAALADRFHVLAPDLPSHGDSADMDAASVTAADLPEGIDVPVDGVAIGPVAIALTLPPLLDHFGVDATHVVGASLGGMAGLIMASHRPDLVRSISLIDVGPQLQPEGVRKIIDFMRAHESFASLEEAAAEIGAYLPQRKNVRPESLTRNLRQRADGRWVWKHGFGRRFRQAEAEGVEIRHPADNLPVLLATVRAAAVTVTCPVLVLRGEESDVLSDEGAQAAVVLIPNARLEVVEKAGHLAAGDNPHSTVRLIDAFLEEQQRGSQP
jgi:pimeloyl-ACP methyl ester carboxylesterase